MSNFLILTSDEHNPLYSSPYGHGSVRTPNMQALADNGVVFDAAYCPSPLCMPSRSALMSGKMKLKGPLVKALRLSPLVDRLNEVISTIPTEY